MAKPDVLPDSATAVAEWLAVPENTARLTNPETNETAVAEMKAALTAAANKNNEMDEQIAIQAQARMGEALRANGFDVDDDNKIVKAALPHDVPKKFHFHNKTENPVFKSNVGPTAELDMAFTNSHDFLGTITPADLVPGRFTERFAHNRAAYSKIMNAYSELIPADGGFLVPEEMRAELLKISLETAVVRSRARILPMSSLTLSVPMVDDIDHSANVWGGVSAQWTEEGGQLTPSTARFGRARLQAKKLTAFAIMPNELLADAVAFQGFFDSMMPEAVSFFEDTAYLNGTGDKEPLGVLDDANTAVIEVARAGANTITFPDIVNMYARQLPASAGRSVWVTSQEAFPQLAQMADAGNNAIWYPNVVGGPPMTILGRPVVISEKVPQLGATADINLIDFDYYLIGDRQQMTAAYSTERYFDTDETGYRIVMRADGRPWLTSAITPANGGNTLSPFLALAA